MVPFVIPTFFTPVKVPQFTDVGRDLFAEAKLGTRFVCNVESADYGSLRVLSELGGEEVIFSRKRSWGCHWFLGMEILDP